jgi:hypothetical protein
VQTWGSPSSYILSEFSHRATRPDPLEDHFQHPNGVDAVELKVDVDEFFEVDR